MSMIDPASMAQQLAFYEIQSQQTQYTQRVDSAESKKDGLEAFKKSLATFTSALNSFGAVGTSILKNTATTTDDSYFTVSAGSSALKGHYDVSVKQLATRHQLVSEIGAPYDSTSMLPQTGTITLSTGVGIDKKSWVIDMASFNAAGNKDLSDFAAYVNSQPLDAAGEALNPGLNVSLIRSNDSVSLMVSGDDTGSDNVVSTDASDTSWFGSLFKDSSNGGVQATMSVANDAVIEIGQNDVSLGTSAISVSSPSNTFENVFDGVALTVNKVTPDGDQPVGIDIHDDPDSTKKTVNQFVDAFNALLADLDYFIRPGDDNNARGPLAGDSSVRSVDNKLSALIRTEFAGISPLSIGLSMDRNGKLTLDSEKFNAALSNNAQAVNEFFLGDGNLVNSFKDTFKPFTETSSNLDKQISAHQRTIDSYESKLDDLDSKYTRYYNQYLNQFTRLNNLLTQMSRTSSLFA